MDDLEILIKQTRSAAKASRLNFRELGELAGLSENAFRGMHDRGWDPRLSSLLALRKGLKEAGHIQ